MTSKNPAFPDDKTAAERRKGHSKQQIKDYELAGGVEGGMPAGSGSRSPEDEEPDDADEELLPTPLTLHSVAVGLDVSHPDHGAGWVMRSEDGVVIVRFEGPGTPPGPERTFDIRRELLMRVSPPEPCPPLPLASLANLGEVEAIAAMLLSK